MNGFLTLTICSFSLLAACTTTTSKNPNDASSINEANPAGTDSTRSFQPNEEPPQPQATAPKKKPLKPLK